MHRAGHWFTFRRPKLEQKRRDLTIFNQFLYAFCTFVAFTSTIAPIYFGRGNLLSRLFFSGKLQSQSQHLNLRLAIVFKEIDG